MRWWNRQEFVGDGFNKFMTWLAAPESGCPDPGRSG